MVGSFVPTSSILRLIISIDCFKAELLIVSNPYLENETSILLLSIFLKSNSKDLKLSMYGFTIFFFLKKKVIQIFQCHLLLKKVYFY